jgi:triosephosphate isomerase
MNKTADEAIEFAKAVKDMPIGKVEAVVCPPFISILALSREFRNSGIKVGAQNVFYEDNGTFTGEVSPPMIKDFCEYVIVGHSERRTVFGETDEIASRKAAGVLKHGMRPIVCVGETREERVSGKTEESIEAHVRGSLKGINSDNIVKTAIAYEPLWAISRGTGDTKTKPAMPGDAEAAHVFIRKVIADMYGCSAAGKVRIIYGGSIKPENIAQFTSMNNIDGALVGGASLDPISFRGLVNNAQNRPWERDEE